MSLQAGEIQESAFPFLPQHSYGSQGLAAECFRVAPGSPSVERQEGFIPAIKQQSFQRVREMQPVNLACDPGVGTGQPGFAPVPGAQEGAAAAAQESDGRVQELHLGEAPQRLLRPFWRLQPLRPLPFPGHPGIGGVENRPLGGDQPEMILHCGDIQEMQGILADGTGKRCSFLDDFGCRWCFSGRYLGGYFGGYFIIGLLNRIVRSRRRIHGEKRSEGARQYGNREEPPALTRHTGTHHSAVGE